MGNKFKSYSIGLLIALLLCTGSLLAQDKVEHSIQNAYLSSVEVAQVKLPIGNLILIPEPHRLKAAKVVLISIQTDKKFLFLRVWNATTNKRIPATKIEDKKYLFEATPGKYFVDVAAFDPEQWEDFIEIEVVGDVAPPPPDVPDPNPQPDNPNPPTIPEDRFENIGRRVYDVAREMTRAERDTWADGFRKAANAMETYSVLTIPEAQKFFSGLTCSNADVLNRLKTLLKEDAVKRTSLSWTDVVAYYKAISVGFKNN